MPVRREPDGFDLGGRDGGEVLLVPIDSPRASPAVTCLSSASFRWPAETAVLNDAAAISVLEVRLRGLNPESRRLLVQLRVSGTLSVAGRDADECRSSGLGYA